MAAEGLVYGGYITTDDNSSPYKHTLRVTVRKFRTLLPGPGNYMIYELSNQYVIEKVAALRLYLADTEASFPGLLIPQDSLPVLVESNTAETEEKVRERIAREAGEAEVIADEELPLLEEGPEFRVMLQHGMAFSAQQVKRMTQGFRM